VPLMSLMLTIFLRHIIEYFIQCNKRPVLAHKEAFVTHTEVCVPHKEACGPIEMQKAYKVTVVIDKKAFVPLAVNKFFIIFTLTILCLTKYIEQGHRGTGAHFPTACS